MHIFEESLFIKLCTTRQQKTVTPTCVCLMLGGLREEKGMRLPRREKVTPFSFSCFLCVLDKKKMMQTWGTAVFLFANSSLMRKQRGLFPKD